MNEIQVFENGEFETWAQALPKRVDRQALGAHVYVIKFSSGVIKVGRTNDPRSRLSSHHADALLHGQRVVRCWVSARHLNDVQNENELISHGRLNCTSSMRNEYFLGLSFESVTRFAASLPFNPVTEEAVALLQERADELLRQWKTAMGYEESASPDAPQDLGTCIDRLFGIQRDGSYRLPDDFPAADSDEIRALIQRVARVTGRSVEDVLQLSWLDLWTETIQVAVANGSLRVRSYALERGLEHLVTPMHFNHQPGLFAIGEIA